MMNEQPLNEAQQALLSVWQQHQYCEFVLKDVEATLATMTENPHILLAPVGTGGVGPEGVRHFYAHQFIPQLPPDMEATSLSLTVGQNRLVEESVVRFTHNQPMEWLLPNIPPTGVRIEMVLIGIIGIEDGKIAYEHLYWDHAAVLAQLGLLADDEITTAGLDSPHRLLALCLPALV